MQKYHFMLFQQDFSRFLEDLMDLGVVDVSWSGNASDDEVEELSSQIKTAELLHKRLSRRKPDENPDTEDQSSPEVPLDDILALEKEWEEIQRKTIAVRKEIALLEPWGDFDFGKTAQLREYGLHVRFYQCPQRQFEKIWQELYPLEIINRIGSQVYFVIFDKGEDIVLPVHEVSLPEKSLHKVNEQLDELETRVREIDNRLDSFAGTFLARLEERITIARDRLYFRQVQLAAERLPDHQLVLVEGWCPVDRQQELEKYLDAHKIAYEAGAPEDDETPPVLLKNNRFSRLFEPIGNLFSLPSNSELDLTAFFAPFFLLFFGFCLGDAGYGIVLLLATTLAKDRVKADFRSYVTLAQLFGLSTLVIGVLSGTFFGLELAKEPAMAAFKDYFLSQDQLFNLALIIGFVQILFGIGIRAYKSVRFQGWKYGMSPIGWIITLLSGIDLTLTELIPSVSMIFLIAGLALIVLFGSPGKPFLLSAGLGVLDLYNITGIIGDLLSYIRLFALGVSSAILGLVVNSIALKALSMPYIGWFFFLLILVIGHTGNLLLASLSAFVHPMRLTFVEFYKNAGFEGGGKPFRAFAKLRPGHPIRQEKTDITQS